MIAPTLNATHPLAPRHIRDLAIPMRLPNGPINYGDPPDGLVLAYQTGGDVWRWWYVVTNGAFREAWCLEDPEGGDLRHARFGGWLHQVP